MFLRSQDVEVTGACRDRAPPAPHMSTLCPKWRFAVDVGAHGEKCQRERGDRWQNLTSAVVVRVDDAAVPKFPPPRGIGGRRGHGDGRHYPRPQRSFLGTFWQRTRDVKTITKFVLMNQPHRF